ncbi:MAG: esterase-like activity of phytase family protein [Acidobacteriota bacterium]
MRLVFSLLVLLLSCSVASAQSVPDVQIRKFEVSVPPRDNVAAPASLKKLFPAGFPIGVGSGLAFAGKDKDGSLLFLSVTDRGPNADSPRFAAAPGDKGQVTKMFPAPGFHPAVAAIKVKGNAASVVKMTPIRGLDGKPVSGLPPAKGEHGATGETPLDVNLKVLGHDQQGIDPEGIAIDSRRGTLWLCDEYGPFLMELDRKTGRIVRKLAPGAGLPSILAKRQPNRGAEGIAVTPSGKVVAAVQSILDTDGKVKDSKAVFTRLVEYDPDTDKTRMLAYPIDETAYRRTADAKIGDVTAVSDTQFLILEQGEGRDGAMRSLVYLVDISRASSLPDLPLETTGLGGMVAARKWLVADLRAMGWQAEKAEGLALVDERTIALASDNDFGLAVALDNPGQDKTGKTVAKPDDYTVGPDGKLALDGKPVATTVRLKPSGEKTALWIITLPKPVTEYMPR